MHTPNLAAFQYYMALRSAALTMGDALHAKATQAQEMRLAELVAAWLKTERTLQAGPEDIPGLQRHLEEVTPPLEAIGAFTTRVRRRDIALKIPLLISASAKAVKALVDFFRACT